MPIEWETGDGDVNEEDQSRQYSSTEIRTEIPQCGSCGQSVTCKVDGRIDGQIDGLRLRLCCSPTLKFLRGIGCLGTLRFAPISDRGWAIKNHRLAILYGNPLWKSNTLPNCEDCNEHSTLSTSAGRHFVYRLGATQIRVLKSSSPNESTQLRPHNHTYTSEGVSLPCVRKNESICILILYIDSVY